MVVCFSRLYTVLSYAPAPTWKDHEADLMACFSPILVRFIESKLLWLFQHLMTKFMRHEKLCLGLLSAKDVSNEQQFVVVVHLLIVIVYGVWEESPPPPKKKEEKKYNQRDGQREG